MFANRLVDEIVTVSEDEIAAAVRVAWSRIRWPSNRRARFPRRAYLSGKLPNGRTRLILTGGNANFETVATLLRRWSVKEVMTRNVIVPEDTPLDEIATTLASKRITGAPVVTGEGHVVGIISETDVFSKKGKVARDIMSPRVISVTEDTGIDEAARLLIGERIRRVPVVRNGKIVGLLQPL